MAGINLISYPVLPSGTLVADTVNYPGGSSDALQQIPTVNGTTVDAAFGIVSTEGGFLLPQLTTAEQNNLVVGSAMALFNTDTNTINYSVNGSWNSLIPSGGAVNSVSGTINQIVSSGGVNPVISLSPTTVFPGTVTLNADPTTALQAATKQYVDNVAAGLNPAESVSAASTGALTVTYNNGAAGVGATLTNAGAQATFTLDGVTVPVNGRVLIKNQASAFQNGIYTVTNAGSNSTNWVLTRAANYDTPANINNTGLIPVVSGTSNANTGWLLSSTVNTIGTDSLTYIQFGAAPPAVTHTLYVSLTGNDTTGNGSQAAPFRTIVHAQTQVVSPSASNQWNINIDVGTFNETALQIIPFVNWIGQGYSLTTIVPNVAIVFNTASWNALASNPGSFSASNLAVTGSLSLLSTGITTSGAMSLYFSNFVNTTQLAFQATSAITYSMTMNCTNYVEFASHGTACIIDGTTINAYGNFILSLSSAGGSSTINSTYENTQITVFGDSGSGAFTVAANGAGSNITMRSYLGYNVTVNATAPGSGASAYIYRDITTWVPGITTSGSVEDNNISSGFNTANPVPLFTLGTSSAAISVVPGTLAANRTYTVPDLLANSTFSLYNTASNTGSITLKPGSINYNTSGSTQSLTLPSSADVGDRYRIRVQGSGTTIIAQLSGQSITVGNSTTTVGTGGSLTNTGSGDCLEIECVTQNTGFMVVNMMGDWTIT